MKAARSLKTARLCAGLLAGLLGANAWAAEQIYSKPHYVSSATGYLRSATDDGRVFRGSGVIARDNRLVYSCAHVLFEGGRWSTNYRFYPAWNAAASPGAAQGLVPRGFRHFSSYASLALTSGGTAAETFDLDFTILYANASFGSAVGWYSDGAAVLGTSSTRKRIIGYPATIDFTGAAGGAFQHATAWFTNPAPLSLGAFRIFDGVSTGPGNSGGPVMVWDEITRKSYLAGILISGTQTTAGVYALDADADTMATDALADVDSVVQRAFTNKQVFILPDHKSVYSERAIAVQGFKGGVRNMTLSLSITTGRRGDLDVYLVSPGGRIQWVSRHGSSAAANVRVSNANYTARYAGQAANGTWKLRMRDVGRGHRATFRTLGLSIAAPSS